MKVFAIFAALLLWLSGGAAFAQEVAAGYVPWGVDEYEFFGLSKTQLTSQFKGKLRFSADFERASFGPVEACHTYDGATFKLGYGAGKVTAVQRIFVGCNETSYGPAFETKEAALKFAILGLSKLANRGALKGHELNKLVGARKQLAAIQAVNRPH